MSKNTVKFPSIADVANDLRIINADLRGDGNDYRSEDDGGAGACDIRLQVMPDGAWTIHVGDSSYDLDHRGFWGSACLDGRRFDSRAVARDLIEQARDHAAQE